MSEKRSSSRSIVLGLAVIAVTASSVAAGMIWSSNRLDAIQEFIGRAYSSMMITGFTRGPNGAEPFKGGTDSTGHSRRRALSPDAANAKVVFQKGSNSSSNIYLITPCSGVSLGLRRGFHPAFSPDGTKIAFVDNTAGATNGFIRLMNADGTNVRNMAQPRQGFSPTWSPDGTRLAFVRGDFDSVGDDGKGDLYVIDMTEGNEGANEIRIPSTIQVSRPSWGSSNRIVFAGMRPRQGGGNETLGIHVTGSIPASSQIAANPPAITAISGSNVNDRDPAWSFDGTQIAFLSTRDYPMLNGSEIYVMDPQGNNARRVTNASNFKSAPAWAPDGTKIVYSRGGSMGSLNANLAMVNADGSNGTTPELITNFSSGDSYPNWGAAAAVIANGNIYFGDGPITSSNIISFDPSSGSTTGGTNLGRGYHPAVSPDGNTIAFVDNTAGSTNNQIMLMNSNGTNRRPLPHPATGFTPTWSPDGKRLAFVVGNFFSSENGSGDIWVMDMIAGAEGANQTKIPNTQNSSNPKWGPNNFILYYSRQSPNPGVGISKLGPIPATSQIVSNPPPATRLEAADPNDREADWSPDGTKIAFRSFRDYPTFASSEIYTMNSDGTGVTRLTNDVSSKANPTWAPDGSNIAFDRNTTALGSVKPDGSDGADATFLRFGSARFPDWGTAAPPSAPVDLSMEAMSDDPDPVNKGSNFSYKFTLLNKSTATATGVKIVFDPIPTNISLHAIMTHCSMAADRKVTCTYSDLAGGASATPNVTFTAIEAGVANVKATVSSNETDPDTSNNFKTQSTTIVAVSDLGITTTSSVTKAGEGQQFNYTVRVTNFGLLAATNVRITNTLPNGLQGVSVQATPANQCGFVSATGVACNPLTLNSSQSFEFTITVRVTRTTLGTITNTASVTSDMTEPNPDPHPNSASVDTRILSSADLSVSIDAPSQINFGENIEYKVRIVNGGPSHAFGVKVANFLPAGLNPPTDVVSFPNYCTRTDFLISCDLGPDLGTIDPGSARQFSIIVRPSKSGTYSNFTSILGHDTDRTYDKNSDNDTANKSVTVVPPPIVDLEVLADFPAQAVVGENLSIAFWAKNHGPSPATGVRIRIQRFSGSDFISISGPSCVDESGGIYRCSIGNLAVGASSSRIVLTVRPSSAGTVRFTAAANGNEAEPSPDPHPNSGNIAINTVFRLSLIGLEVTQAVQDLKNSVPLIDDKRTFVRAYLRAPSTAPTGGVTALATLIGTNSADGVERTLKPSNTGGMINVLRNPDRGQLSDSFYFELPDSLTAAGTLQFRIESDQPLDCAEPDGTPNCATSVTFRKTTKVLDVRFYSLGYKSGNNTIRPSNRNVDQVLDEFRALFPTSYVKYDSFDWTTPADVNKPTSLDEFNKVNDQLMTQYKLDCRNKKSVCSKQYVGLLRNPSGSSLLGLANGIPGDVCSTYIDGTLTPGHELGHSLGLRHTNYNAQRNVNPREPGFGTHTPNDGTISSKKDMYDANTIYGFDVNDTGSYLSSKPGRIYGPNTPDFMGYAAARPWISEHSYARVLSSLQGISGSDPNNSNFENPENEIRETVGADDIVVLSGIIPLTMDSVPEFSSVYIINSPGDLELPPAGTYAVRLEGAGGQVLASYSFEPDIPSGATDLATFNLMLPWDTNARRISILKDGQQILSRQASANKPVVTVTAPNGGETFSEASTQLQWTATDADGDDLEYLVQFSDDGGSTWRVLIANLAAATYELDLSNIGGTSQGLIRVTASDGFNTSQDQSDAVFTVTPHPPQASISTPVSDSLFVGDQNIYLRGSSYDAEDGSLPDAALSWSSNLNGPLGTGSSLAIDASTLQEGTHTITLSATDSSSQSGSTSVTIQVFRTRPVLPASLSTGPTVLAFNANFGSDTTDPQTLSIRNSGDGDLTWSAAADQSWIKLASTTGTAPSNSEVTIDATGLAIGNYSGKITVTTADAANSPQVVNVDLAVVQGPPLRADGRVLTPNGRGLSNAAVSIVDSDGEVRKTFTSSLGFFTFSNLPSGKSYTVRVTSKRYRFSPRTMVLANDITLEDFVGIE